MGESGRKRDAKSIDHPVFRQSNLHGHGRREGTGSGWMVSAQFDVSVVCLHWNGWCWGRKMGMGAHSGRKGGLEQSRMFRSKSQYGHSLQTVAPFTRVEVSKMEMPEIAAGGKTKEE
jgi:hypothetical protein